MFVIAKDGTLAYQGAIDDRPSPEGDPRTASNYAREAATKLLAGERFRSRKPSPTAAA
jgi:hypothetical protein